jgi:hypothetical protein
MKRWRFLILLAVVILAEIIAMHCGWISGRIAIGIFLIIEALIAAVALYRDSDHPIRRLLATELKSWVTLVLLIRGKSEYPTGAMPLYGYKRWYQLPAIFTAAVVIEIIAVEMLVSIGWLRVLLLVLSIYSLLLLWAWFAGSKVHPSYIQYDTVVLRQGRKIIATIPLTDIARMTYQRGYSTDLYLVQDDTVTLGNSEGTNIAITLHDPIPMKATGYFWQRLPMLDVKHCHIWLDDPDSLIKLRQP